MIPHVGLSQEDLELRPTSTCGPGVARSAVGSRLGERLEEAGAPVEIGGGQHEGGKHAAGCDTMECGLRRDFRPSRGLNHCRSWDGRGEVRTRVATRLGAKCGIGDPKGFWGSASDV